MSGSYVTVANFNEPIGAEIARGKLESEGIATVLTGGNAATAFSGFNNLGGRIELRVPAEDLARAVQILAEGGDADRLTEEGRNEGDGGPMWVCPLCGDAVRAVLPLCPACHTPRGKVPDYDPDADEPEEGIQTAPTGPSRGIRQTGDFGEEHVPTGGEVRTDVPAARPAAAADEDGDEPPAAKSDGDAAARRAFLAALFGLPSAGLLTLYSMWLLFSLGSSRGELGPRGMRFLYLALFVNVLVLLLAFFSCSGAIW